MEIAEGEFARAYLSFETGNSYFDLDDTTMQNDLIGMALGIRLIHKNGLVLSDDIPKWASEIAFDDARLSDSPVPFPPLSGYSAQPWSGCSGLVNEEKLPDL